MTFFTHASRSQMFDRVVRVDRRLRVNDGAYGTYPDYETKISRYWVRLWPDQHKRRERVSLGEQEAKNDYRAIGPPARNGSNVQIGDRFVDEKNNECYDVVAVRRPPPRLAYSAAITYELRIIKDGCPPAPTGYPTVPQSIVEPPAQTHFIMRHFGDDEILDWEALPYFDGFVYNLQHETDEKLEALVAIVAAGKRYFRYYNIQSYPFGATEFGGDTPPLTQWYNYLRDNVPFSGVSSNHRLRVGDLVAIFPGNDFTSPLGQQHELIPWGVIPALLRADIIAQMVALANAPSGAAIECAGVFLDQSWLEVHDFQVDETGHSGHGDTKESQPGLEALSYAAATAAFGDGGPWTTHTAALSSFYDEIAAALAPTGKYALKNGEHRERNGTTIPKPWYYENAWNSNVDGQNQPERWANAKAGFLTDPRNVISILCQDASNETIGVPDALDFWVENGGWIAFTSNSATGVLNQELAYSQAAARLAALGFPS